MDPADRDAGCSRVADGDGRVKTLKTMKTKPKANVSFVAWSPGKGSIYPVVARMVSSINAGSPVQSMHSNASAQLK
jgi:hypothetical protein